MIRSRSACAEPIRLTARCLFHAGDYSVDLRFEHEKGSASMVLVGQIANQKTPDEVLANLPVILVAGNREVTRSISNTFGEFQMEYVPETDLRLLVPLESRGQELEVLLERRPSCRKPLSKTFHWIRESDNEEASSILYSWVWRSVCRYGADTLHADGVPQQRRASSTVTASR